MPLYVSLLQKLIQGQSRDITCYVKLEAGRDEVFDKPMQVGVSRKEVPVEPTDLAVMAVGIIIASLSSPDLITHQDHRHPWGQKGDAQKILHLPVPELFDCRTVRRALNAAVPA